MGLFDFLKGAKNGWKADQNLPTILDAVMADTDYKTLANALKAAGLADVLKKKGPFTLFVPNNSAFQDVADLKALTDDKAKLKTVLTYHVVADWGLSYDDLIAKKTVATMAGKDVAIDASGLLKIGGANIIRGNIKCRNGYIHVIDKVLVP